MLSSRTTAPDRCTSTALPIRGKTTRAALCIARQCNARPVRRRCEPRRSATLVCASSDVEVRGIEEASAVPSGSNYVAIGALAAFAADYYGQISLTLPFLLKALAWYAVVNACALIVFREGAPDHVSTVLAPAALAVHALGLPSLDVLTTVTAVVGFYIARDLKGLPFWGWIATLVGSIYWGYGSTWVVLAYAFGTLVRLLDGLEHNKIPVLSIPVLAVAAFALYYEYKTLFVVSIALGEVARSYFKLAKSVRHAEPRGLTDKQ